jgi:hypothetical protein
VLLETAIDARRQREVERAQGYRGPTRAASPRDTDSALGGESASGRNAGVSDGGTPERSAQIGAAANRSSGPPWWRSWRLAVLTFFGGVLALFLGFALGLSAGDASWGRRWEIFFGYLSLSGAFAAVGGVIWFLVTILFREGGPLDSNME